jgi:alcohol dehydrogenase
MMRSLVLEEARLLRWHEVPAPERQFEREAIVRPLAVATCDLDWPTIFGLTPFPLPIQLGHECVAEVVDGPEIFTPGEKVIVPFQISCGACERCRRGLTGSCATVSPRQMYGFGRFGGERGGMLSDLALVPYAEAMLVRIPKAIDAATVPSAADNIPDGWRTVALALAELPGADVLVVGGAARSIALYAVDAAMALGAASVTYVDEDAERLRVAGKLGARTVEGGVGELSGEFPVTVDGTATPEGLVSCLRLTERGGHCTTIGQMVPEAPLPLWDMYERGLHLHIGPGMARPVIPTILDLVAAGRLRPEIVTSATVDWEDAPEALLEPTTKLVITRGS